MKRHGCILTYLLYIVIYFVYFILIGKLLSSLLTGIPSDTLLTVSLFLAAVCAVITAVAVMNWKKIVNYTKSKRKSL